MPIYEYQCAKCGRVSNFLVRNIAAHQPPACPKCGHPQMTRAVSRFAAPKGGAKSPAPDASAPPAESAAPPGSAPPGMPDLSGVDENDPRAMGRMMRQMAAESGEPLPQEMDEVVRRLESGEDPEKIEEKLGEEFGGESEGGGGSDDTLYDA